MNKRVYGYARVSSKGQNLDRQIVELEKYVDNRFIFTDKQSGKDMDRVEYQLLRKVAQAGDTIYIQSLDRLGRNKEDIKQELEHYKLEGVRVMILEIPTTMMEIPKGQEWLIDMINNLLLEVLSTMAEQERLTTRERQRQGIAQAQAKGKHLGRPVINLDTIEQEQKELIKEYYPKWKAKEITATKFMQIVELKRNTFYKIIKQYEELEG